MMRRLTVLTLAILSTLVFASVASAQVSVWPKQSPVNGFERYTVRVPNEKDNATVKVKVEMPAGSTFSAVLPVAGWTFTPEKDAAGKAVALAWSGGEIKPGEFFEFGVSVRNPKDAADVPWKPYQTYQDGETVEWVGPSGAEKPAPMVKLTPATGAAGGHGETAPPAQQAQTPATPAPTAPAPTAAANSSGGAGNWLGGAPLAVSAVALILAVKKR